LDTAVAYWNLLLVPRHPIVTEWTTFVTENYKRGISKDTWNMILEFTTYYESDPSLASYDEEAAWPSVIDEFVEYLREKMK
jgi:DCN1-like protein 1/2